MLPNFSGFFGAQLCCYILCRFSIKFYFISYTSCHIVTLQNHRNLHRRHKMSPRIVTSFTDSLQNNLTCCRQNIQKLSTKISTKLPQTSKNPHNVLINLSFSGSPNNSKNRHIDLATMLLKCHIHVIRRHTNDVNYITKIMDIL